MITVISLGTPACNVARELEAYSVYQVHKIDDEDLKKQKGFHKIPRLPRPEDYEGENFRVPAFLKKVSGDVLFMVSGSSRVSAASLVILEQLKQKCKISVLYMKPNEALISEESKIQSRVVGGILQEYARSGIFEKMFLVCNATMEGLIGPSTIYEVNDKINQMISYNLYMLGYLQNSKPLRSTISVLPTAARICTLGVFNCETAETFLFFPLDIANYVRYYYSIPKEALATVKGLLSDKTKILPPSTTAQKVSYGIYESASPDEYGVTVAYSLKIQN